MAKKRLLLLLCVLVVIALLGIFVLPAVFSSGTKSSSALAAGYIITETDGVLTAPVQEPWIAFRKNMNAQDWRYLGSSVEGELTGEVLAGMKTVVLCDGSVGAWSSYSGIGTTGGTKQSEEISMTYIDVASRRRLGLTDLLSAQKLPNYTTSLSAVTYSDKDVLTAIRNQVESGIIPGYAALGKQDKTWDHVAAMPPDTDSVTVKDMHEVSILIMPENVTSLPEDIAAKVWFVVVNPGSGAAAWAEENGIPYLLCGDEYLTVPENTDPQRISCPHDLFMTKSAYLRVMDNFGLYAIRLPDQMAPDAEILTGSLLPFIVTPGSKAERALIDANRSSMNAGWTSPELFAGEGALAVRERQRVFFGSYNQDGYPENGGEPIPWDVVTVHGDQVLLLSSWVLDLQPLSGDNSKNWVSSSLRAWLNSTFLDEAFTEEEQRSLLPCAEDDNERKILPAAGGEDRVFIPGYADNDSFHPLYTLIADVPASPYVLSFGIPNEYGKNNRYVYSWYNRGNKRSYGSGLGQEASGVRPMIWVSLTDPLFIAENSPVQPEAPAQTQEERLAASVDSLKAGDTVSFGAWNQDGISSAAEEIDWIVLEVKNGKALLLSRDILLARQVDENVYYDSWEGCDLRFWLDADFFNGAFTAEQRKAIVLADVKNSDDEGYPGWEENNRNTPNTKEHVFLLSYKDAYERYFTTDEARMARPTLRALYDGIRVADGCSSWWLRCMGEDGKSYAAVSENGTLASLNQQSPYVGVRPALWLDLSAFKPKAD